MKKTAKVIITLMFCLSIISATMVSAFAVNQVKGLKTKATTYNSATITWTKTSGVKGYSIEQYKNKKWTEIKATTATSYTVTGLTSGTTYNFRVRAYTQSLIRKTYGAYSSTLKVNVVPEKVTGFKVSALSYNAAKLSWTKVAGASGYYLQKYVSGKWVKVASGITANSYTVKSLTVNTKYTFRICAYRTVSGKAVYGAYSANLAVTPKIAQVTGFKAASTTYNSISLTWTKVSGASAYYLQKYVSGKWVKVASGITTNSYTVKSLTTKTKYSFRVCAYRTISGKAVYGAYSATVSATPTLSPVTGLTAGTVTTSSIPLSWKAVSGATGYQVEKYASKKWTRIKATTSTSYTVSSLDAGTNYYYRVRAYRTVGSSYAYSAYTDTLKVTTATAAPTELKVSDKTSSTITLSWTASKGATGYRAYIYDYATKKWTGKAVTKNTVTFTDLAITTKYAFKVAAYSVINSKNVYSAYSETIKDTTAFSKVTNITLGTNKESGRVSMVWSSVKDAAKYFIEKYNKESNKWELVSETTRITATDNISETEDALYRIYAVNNSGISGPYSKALSTISSDTKSDAYVTKLTWEATPGAESYTIYSGIPGSSVFTEETTVKTNSANLYLAPQSVQNIKIVPNIANGDATDTSCMTVTFTTADFKIENTDASKKSQVLYLVRAINNAKREKTQVTVNKELKTEYSVDKIKFGIFEFSGSNINDFITFAGNLGVDTKDLQLSQSAVENKNITFVNGAGTYETTNTDGQKVTRSQSLVNFMEPATQSNMNAYLYGAQTSAPITNGFTKVSTTPLGSGYQIDLTIKQEKNNAQYHNGFLSSIDASSLAGASGDGITSSSKVGASTITGTIDANGNLTSLTINSPFTVSAKFQGDDTSLDLDMKGSTYIKYMFKR